ncbi:hypothetical protein EKK58_00760 [Candidatus Dependentiae bacterium]|nr:MAG: hypothetical protein EKK58_00760 [Candidatus Dependentiae bacterium]
MATLPSLPDLTVGGVSPEFFLERLKAYAGTRHGALWVVRWNGRIRSIQGMAFFHSRESAHDAVVKWLRDAGRWALSGHHELTNRLPKNWCYKKAYRTYIDQLVGYLEETAFIEYMELQGSAIPDPIPAPTQTLIG